MSLSLDTRLKGFSPQSRAAILALWQSLPPDLRRTFGDTLGTLDKLVKENPAAITDLVRTIKTLFDPVLQPLTTIAVVGPVNVGKSSIHNALLPPDSTPAEVSPVPGTTKEVQETDLGLFTILDTPGADHGASVGEAERQRALDAARDADFLLMVFDASRGILSSDKALYDELAKLGKRHLVALNKIDLIAPRERPKVRQSAAEILGLAGEEVLLTSATKRIGIESLVLELAAAEPRLLAHLGQVLTPLRRELAWQAVRRSTSAAALVALTPLPMLDLFPLAAIQISMILTVSRIYGRKMTMGRAAEMLGTFGIGMLARTMFYELAKLGGLPGWILAASVAASATLAMGWASMRWFETGHKPSKAELKHVTQKLQSGLLEALKSLGRRRPNKKKLTQVLDEQFPDLEESIYSPGSSGL
jgi:small GTP-binding protein